MVIILSCVIGAGVLLGASYTLGLRKGHANGVEFERWRIMQIVKGERPPEAWDEGWQR